MNNKIIYITGCDGSGKTTFIKKIDKILSKNGNPTNCIWLRSPKLLSKPLMLYCRIVGLTRYKKINGVRYGKHNFYKSKFVSFVFPILQLFDFKIKWFFLKKSILKDQIILFDRFNIDTLADLMVDTHRFNLHKTKIGKLFIKILPANSKVFILNVNENIIRKRKVDTRFDENLSNKIKVYDILAKDLDLKIIKNNKKITDNDNLINKIIS